MRKNRIALGLALSLAISNIPLVSYADEISNSEVVESSVDSEESTEENKENTEENTEESTEESTDENTEESTEESSEESTTESTEESTTESTEESTTKSTEESSEESTVEIKESINISSSKSSTRKSRSSKAIDESDRTQGSNITLKVATSSDATDPDNPDGGGGDTPVDPETFSVTVPVTIPISMDLEGKISIPSDLKIVNNNESAIKCVDIDLMLDGSWNAVDFDSFSSDVQSLSNTNDFSIAFRGDKLGSDGLISVTENSWNFGANDSLSLNTRARLTKQQAGLESDLGTVNFSFDWSNKETSSSNDIGSEIPENLTPSSEKITVTFVAPEGVSFKGISGNLEVSVGETITLPEVEISNLRQSVGSWLNAETQEPVTVVDGKLTVDKAMSLTVSLVDKVASNKNWFTASGNTLTGLSDEYLNLVDAPTDLVIPNNIGGSSITSIGSGAFSNKDLLTSIVIPYTVTSIASDAFSGTSADLKIDVSYASRYPEDSNYISGAPWGKSLSNFVIETKDWDTDPVFDVSSRGLNYSGNTVTLIRKTGVKDIVIPTSINGVKVQYIGKVADAGDSYRNTYVNTITIPNTVTEIGERAFYNYGALKEVNLPNSVTSISKLAFEGTFLTELNVPDSVVNIEDTAFRSVGYAIYNGDSPEMFDNSGVAAIFKSKEEVPEWDIDPVTSSELASRGLKFSNSRGISGSGTIPEDGIIKIPSSVDGMRVVKVSPGFTFENSAIKEVYYPPMMYAPIQEGPAFTGCAQLTKVRLPLYMNTIEKNCFKDCTNLIDISIPNTVKNIEESAFSGCTNLQLLIIPDSVTTIGAGAFTKVPEITYNGIATGSPWGASKVTGQSVDISECVTITKTGILLPVKDKINLLQGDVVIPEMINGVDVKSIGENCFQDNTNITSISLPSTLTSIAYKSFYGCTGLTSVDIPDSVTTIGGFAFYGCTSLSINIPESVTRIGEYAFKSAQIKYSGLAKDRPWGAASVIDKDGKVIIVDNDPVTKDELLNRGLTAEKFTSTDGERIIIGISPTFKGNFIKIPSSVDGVLVINTKPGIFKGNKNITEVTLPNSLLFLGKESFSGCTNLNKINSSALYFIEEIKDSTFNGCTSLQTLFIPNTVKTIGTNAFLNVPEVIYSGTATGSPWGAKSVVPNN